MFMTFVNARKTFAQLALVLSVQKLAQLTKIFLQDHISKLNAEI